MAPRPTTISWSTICKRTKSISKQSKLKQFFYKLAHRIVTTKKVLCLYGTEDNKNCRYCGNDDSLFHSVDFLRKVLCRFNRNENLSIKLNSEEILFGTASDNDTKLKKNNFCLLYAKFHFHFQKINLRECNWCAFVR